MTIELNEQQRSDAAHHIHPFSDAHALADAGTRIIEKASGVYLWDSNGHKMLDAHRNTVSAYL